MSWLKHKMIQLVHCFPTMERRFIVLNGLMGRGVFDRVINEAISHFPEKDIKNEREKSLIMRDMRKCYIRYNLLPIEYFYFEFAWKEKKQREMYLTNYEEDAILERMIGYNYYLRDLSDKWHFYELAKRFFHRAVLLFDGKNDKSDFVDYCMRVSSLFVKPLAGSEGKGAFKADIENIQVAEQLYDELAETNAKWMVEERIKQSSEMSAWNASSVNTVRLPSFLNKNGFFVLGPILRTGRTGKCVDNTSAGGVFALIDSKNGIITTKGYDVNNQVYERHPDTNIRFEGYQIPYWDKLIETAKQAHQAFPNHLYIAWDFALTEKGWELIEGNWGRFRGAQIAGKKGLKKEFLEYMSGGTIA